MTCSAGRDSDSANCFEFKSIDELVQSCIDFYESSLRSLDSAHVCSARTDLSKCVQRFHEDCGTLTSSVKDGVERLQDDTCIVLMTAHQPNLFAYGGVVRKPTLSYVLQKRLARCLNQPVVSLFGIADQDFTDDRWVRSAQLPDVERRQGLVELRFRMPEKMILNRIAKPSAQVLDDWRNEIVGWLHSKLGSIKRISDFLGLDAACDGADLFRNLEDFWDIVVAAHGRAKTFSDFNAFVTSNIVNGVWGYDTLFFRFSESQQIFEEEFRSLLSSFNAYSKCVKDASLGKSVEGVYQQEHRTVPFWYHCDCGSKVRLIAERRNESLIGRGECLRCGDTYLVDLGSYYDPDISRILPRISARALSMPLVFFDGLNVCCYVGGLGGREYLSQAKYVAEHLNRVFPPVVIWRPKDIYLGVAQLEALMYYRRYSGTFDFSQYSRIMDEYEGKIQRLREESGVNQSKVRSSSVVSGNRETDISVDDDVEMSRKNRRYLPEVTRDLKLLENIATVLSSHFCIADYAVNVGLRSTSEQWMAFLEKGGNLSSNISLETGLDDLFPLASIEINRE